MSPFTPTMLERVKKEVLVPRKMLNASIARRKVTTSRNVGLQGVEKKEKVLNRKERGNRRKKRVSQLRKRQERKRRLRRHG